MIFFKLKGVHNFLKEHNNFSKFIEYKPDHTEFGGIIYEYDFGSRLTMKDISNRISNNKFNKICKQKKGETY